MQTLENYSAASACLATENVAPTARYEAVRLNAMKHGILSQAVVLAHESHAEFSDLLTALTDEHRPLGMTEQHLVEELATVIWRKRRVLLAEGAKINESLMSAANRAKSVIAAAAPFQPGMSVDMPDLRDYVNATPEQSLHLQRKAEIDLAATQKAAAILRKNGRNAYAKALRLLSADSCDWWQESIGEGDGEYPETVDGLATFIRDAVEPTCYRVLREAIHTPAIKAQTLGEGVQAHRLEKLARYETHLDRKFERTLAMLIRLKEMRLA